MKIIILFIAAIIGFLSPKQEIKTYKISGYAQGTTYHITYYATDSVVVKSDIERLLAKVDSSLSIYKPYSLINKFNNSPRGIEMDDYLKQVSMKALKIYRQTDGAFDMTVYPLVAAWGFGVNKVSLLPDSASIKAILPCVGSDKLEVKGDSLIKKNKCVKIDVNGIAQGYTVDLLAELLMKKNIDVYMVELGGEIRVKGRKPDGHWMKIGIESPTKNQMDPNALQTTLQLKKGAVTTSGNYRKFVQAGNAKVSHLINPKTGFYLKNEMISVTVVAKDAISADGYDNALMGMGLSEALEFANRNKNIEAYIIYQQKDGTVADTSSNNFHKLSNGIRN